MSDIIAKLKSLEAGWPVPPPDPEDVRVIPVRWITEAIKEIERLHWKLAHPNSLAEKIPVIKVNDPGGDPVDDALAAIRKTLARIDECMDNIQCRLDRLEHPPIRDGI